MALYDSLVIGGGPAGLSAAIYMARINGGSAAANMANYELYEPYQKGR